MAAGATVETTATYVITVADVTAGRFKNTVTAAVGNISKEASATVTTEQVKITITAESDSKVYDSKPLTNDGWSKTTGELVNGDTIDSVTVTGSQTLVGSSDNVPSAAVIKNTAGEDVTAGYDITYENGTLTVTDGTPDKPVDPALVVTKADANKGPYHVGDTVTFNITATNIYDKAQTITLSEITDVTLAQSTFTDVAAGATVSTTATYVIKAADVTAGSFKNTVTAAVGNISKEASATVTTEQVKITITAESDSKVYDSKPLTNDGWSKTTGELVNGDTIDSVTVTGSQTLVGSSDNVPSAAVIKNTAGEDVTAGYDITYENGTLTVTDGTPDKPVDPALVVTKADANKGPYHVGDTVTFNVTATNIYDAAQTITLSEIAGVTLAQSTFENVAAGATVETTATYVITVADVTAGSFTNTVTATLGNIEKTADATVSTEKVAITIQAADGSKVYDSTPLTNDGWSKTEGELVNGDTITSVTVTGSQTLVGESDNVPSNAKIVDATGTDVTAAYAITYKNGTLKVTDGTGPDDPPVNPDDVGSKTHEDKKYKLGETITWNIEATNIYNEVKTITFVEKEGFTLEQSVFEDVAPGGIVKTKATHVVTEADILAGEINNTVTVKYSGGTDIEIPDEPAEPEEKNPHLTITKKTTSNMPDNGYALGDTITYEIRVKNDGNVTIKDITLTDTVKGYNAVDITANLDKTELAPGDEAKAAYEHKVTEQDILAGEVVNTATATGKDPDKDEPEVVPGTTDPDPTEDLDTTLSVNKKVTSQPANGKAFVLGEEISYDIIVKNEGNVPYTNVTVTDKKTNFTANIETLGVGEEKTFTTRHQVTEEDIKAGEFANTAVAEAKPIDDPHDPDNPKIPKGEDTVTTGDPDDPDGPVPPIAKGTVSVEIRKDTVGTVNIRAGSVVNYVVTVKNTGDIDLEGVKIEDSMFGTLASGITIKAGETTEPIRYPHTVTAEEASARRLINTVTVIVPADTTPDGKEYDFTHTHTVEETTPPYVPVYPYTPVTPGAPAGGAAAGDGLIVIDDFETPLAFNVFCNYGECIE